TPQKIVLIGAAGIKHDKDVRNLGYVIIAKAGKLVLSLPGFRNVRQKAKGALYKSIGSQDYLRSGTMKEIFIHTIREDLSDQASRITLPTLLIWGEHDEESPIEDARQFNRLIQGSELHIIPNSGHFVHTEQADTVNELIGAFLS
ncbi:MAG: alpha/beta fold hydrolase, partial [Microcoleus sp.]